jgi:transcriptional regulator with XRE-family HTH domain
LSSVGGRIAYARAAKGLTMDQLAGKVGVSKSAISQWERGRIETMKAHHLLNLAKVLEVSPTWLWEWKDDKGQPVPMGRRATWTRTNPPYSIPSSCSSRNSAMH